MRKNALPRILPLLAALLLIAGCLPNLPTAPVQPSLDPTQVSQAARATVTAQAAQATQPPVDGATVTPTFTPLAPSLEAPQQPTSPSTSEFWLAYQTQRKLAVMNSDGSKIVRLTNTPDTDYLPKWSPDGKILAFLRFGYSGNPTGALSLLPLGADYPQTVDGSNAYSYFDWMLDSQTLLGTRGNSGTFEIYLVDIRSGTPRQIAKAATDYPRLSPDGKMIALLISTGTPCDGKGCMPANDLYLYDVASGQTKRLTGDAQPKTALAWSPDSRQVAFRFTEVPDTVDIFQPDGAVVAQNQTPPWWTNPWVRSPDGKQIAYHTNTTTGNVFLIPAAGGEARQVAKIEPSANKAISIDTLRWRPDGSGLVFNSFTTVYTVNRDGTGLRELPLYLENVFFDVRPAADVYTPPLSPTPPAQWPICPGALDSRLDVGRTAVVSSNPPTPNNVRSGPSKKSDLVGQIQPGEKVTITGGPICENGFIWWEIKSLSSGLKGYSVEGDTKTYWLVPVP